MTFGGVGGVGGVHPLQNQPGPTQTGGPVHASFGSKVSAFFSAIGSGIKQAFVSFGNAVSGLFARGADAAAAKSTPGVYTSAEKRQMLADFRQSATYQAVQGGDALNKGNLESGAEKILGSPTALQAMKAGGLSLTEAVSIFMYTTGDYSSINAQLRTGRVSGDVRAVTDECISGMAKLPPHDETVSRLVNLPDRVAAQHVEGATIQYDAFTSTSTKPNGDENFNGNMFMLMEPKPGSSGKDVSMFSNLPDEQEVLFPPGTQFQVIERTEPKDQSSIIMGMDQPHSGKINVTLQEV
jgi:hypothetical protein